MSIKETKFLCDICRMNLKQSALLVAKNPFENDSDVFGCPNCRSIDNFTVACDEPDCWLPVTQGRPTSNGYRRTCHKH
jgi:hypothetical protein